MSTKPVDTGRFAVDGSNVDATNISTPSSGLRATGFPDDYVPPASEFNYLENVSYRWRQYLNDGALQGNHSVSGDLSVTGNLSFGGALAIGGALTVTGLLTASAGVTLAANQNLIISGTGLVKHGAREKAIDAVAFAGDSSSTRGAFDSTGHFISTFIGAGLVCAPVDVLVGGRILTFQQFYSVNNTAATLTPRLRRIDLASGTVSTIWAGVGDNTGGAGVVESQTGTSLNHVVLSGSAYFAEVTITNNSHRVHGAIITYDQP